MCLPSTEARPQSKRAMDSEVGASPRQRIARRGHSRQRRLRAWMAATVALVVALAPLLGVLHRMFVPHLVCEHGDLIELQGERLGQSAAPSLDDHGERSRGVRQATGAAMHGHDHCSLAALARAGSMPTREPPPLLTLSTGAASRGFIDQQALYRSILLLAPKTSPPGSAPALCTA
jgi:hypothetical protein